MGVIVTADGAYVAECTSCETKFRSATVNTTDGKIYKTCPVCGNESVIPYNGQELNDLQICVIIVGMIIIFSIIGTAIIYPFLNCG